MYKIKKLCFNSDVRQSKHCNNNKLWREQPNISLVVEYTRDEVQIIQFSFLSKFNNFLKWQCKAVWAALLKQTFTWKRPSLQQLSATSVTAKRINYGRCQAFATVNCQCDFCFWVMAQFKCNAFRNFGDVVLFKPCYYTKQGPDWNKLFEYALTNIWTYSSRKYI
jgi:hypothetical protein